MNDWVISKIIIIIILLTIKVVVYLNWPFGKTNKAVLADHNNNNTEEIDFSYSFGNLMKPTTQCTPYSHDNRYKICISSEDNSNIGLKMWFSVIHWIGIGSCIYYIIGLIQCKKLPGRLLFVTLACIGLIYEIYVIIYILETDLSVKSKHSNVELKMKLEKQPGYYLYIIS